MGNRKPQTVECLQPQDFTVRALISEHVNPDGAYLDFRSLEVKAMRRFGLRAGDRVDVTFHRVSSEPPPKPPEPPVRMVKEGHIPPRTDGHVSWWRRLWRAT
jgi:hypothetical protein